MTRERGDGDARLSHSVIHVIRNELENSTSRDARATRGGRRRWTTTRIDARRSMDFVARARARETPRGGGQEATTSATSGREILLREARDARDARRWARERASAAVRCQRARRRHVARREATRREIEALDAVIERMAREANANAARRRPSRFSTSRSRSCAGGEVLRKWDSNVRSERTRWR